MSRLAARALIRGAVMVGALIVVLLVGGVVLAWRLHSTRGVAPILAQSMMFGCLYALFAVGIVIVYRASRVINLAHPGVWVVCYTLFWELLGYHGISYWITFPAAVVAGGLLGVAAELLFVRRFFRAPRLIVFVVTIGLGQLMTALAIGLPGMLGDHDNRPGVPRTPLTRFSVTAFPIRFTGDYGAILAATVVALLLLGAFFRYTRMGIAVRGAAQNSDRAAELGINVKTLSTVVWGIAGLLAGLSAALQIPVTGYSASGAQAGVGASLVIIALAAAVVGGMDNVPITVVACLCIAVISQVVFFAFHQSALVDVVLLFVIIGAFAVQRRRLGRADESSASSWAASEEVRPVPRELSRLPVVRVNARRLLVAAVVVVLGYPFVMSPSQTNLGSLIFIDSIVVISLVVLSGWGGQVSLGQYAIVAVGAFAGSILSAREHLPFLLAILGGGLAGSAVAVVLGLTALRIRGLYLAVTTLAFAVVVSGVVLTRSYLGKYIPDRVGRPRLLFLKTEDNRVYYYVCLAAVVLAWWCATGLRRSRTGRVLIATRDNERSAQAFGVNLVRTRLVTFAISGFMSAAAGVLLAAHDHTVSAGAFAPSRSIQIFLIAVIGGLGSVQGALTGAIYFAIVDFFVHGVAAQLLASSGGALLVLYLLPGGLGSLVYKARDSVLRRIAIRRRIWVPALFSDAATVAALNNRAPLAPPAEKDVPAVYRQPSRIRVAGASQAGPKWTYG